MSAALELDSALVLLAITPMAAITVTSTTSGPRLIRPPRTFPGQPVIFDVADTRRVTPPLIALARLATRQAPFVLLVGGTQPLRDRLSAALVADRPGLAFSWPHADHHNRGDVT